jgi:transposase
MRGMDARSGELFSYVDLEKRVPAKHPLRLIRVVVNDVLAGLDGDFSRAYADSGRPSIAPERQGEHLKSNILRHRPVVLWARALLA